MLDHVSVDSNQFGSVSFHPNYVAEKCEEEKGDKNSDVSEQNREEEVKEENEEEQEQPMGVRDPEPGVCHDDEDSNQPKGVCDPEPTVHINQNDRRVEEIQAVITDVRIVEKEDDRAVVNDDYKADTNIPIMG